MGINPPKLPIKPKPIILSNNIKCNYCGSDIEVNEVCKGCGNK